MRFCSKLTPLALATIVSALTVQAQAQETASDDESGFQFVISAGITFGGDDFVAIEDEDGDHVDDLEAGGFLYLGAGTNYRFSNSPISIQAVYAYHFDSVDADNGDASFDRFDLDLTVFYNTGAHRIGTGLTHHFSPSLDVDADFFDGDVDFDDATGFLVEYNYMFSQHGAIGVRYTFIDYEASDVDADEVDGDHIGLFINGFF